MAVASAEQNGGHDVRIDPIADNAVVELAMAHMALTTAQRRFDAAQAEVIGLVTAGQATGAQVLGVLARCNVQPSDELINEFKRDPSGSLATQGD
jgi:hypothetical protein